MGRSTMSPSLIAKALNAILVLGMCVGPVLSTVCFSGNSYKNSSGHWNVEATVTHKDTGDESRENGQGTRRWFYQVEVSTLNQEDVDSVQVVFKVTAPPRRVGSDYTLYPGFGYYKHNEDWTNWNKAKESCEKDGAHLMIINSKEEAEIFKKVLQNITKGQRWVHVGFHDPFQDGKYSTVQGAPLKLSGYTEWGSGEPSNDDNELCGGARVESAELLVVNCNDGADFICEQEL